MRKFNLVLLGVVASATICVGNEAVAQDAAADGSFIRTDTGSANSAENGLLTAEEALVLDARSYATSYNVSLDEAMMRIAIMSGTGEDIEALGEELNNEVSGMYFDNGPNFGLKVKTTGVKQREERRLMRRAARQADRKAERQAARQKARQAARQAGRKVKPVSEAELAKAEAVLDTDVSTPVQFISGAQVSRKQMRSAIQSSFDQIRSLVKGLSGIAYDEKEGDVVVQIVQQDASLSDADKAAVGALFPVPVKFEMLAKPIGPVQAQGGRALTDRNGEILCTAAFVGFDPSNRPGVFTAAHCDAIGGLPMYIRDVTGLHSPLTIDTNLNLYTTRDDILFLRTPTNLKALPQFIANKGEAARTLVGRRSLATTTVASGTVQGSYACFYGMTSSVVHGQGCGTVRYKEFAASTLYSQGKMTVASGQSYYVQVQGATSGMRCAGGDSGAPWFLNNIAFGIMSSCNENAINGSSSVANYTSMDAAYARAYKLAY